MFLLSKLDDELCEVYCPITEELRMLFGIGTLDQANVFLRKGL